MGSRVVSYTWAKGVSSGSSTDHQATSTLGVIWQAVPLTTVLGRPIAPLPFWAPEQLTDQLREWGSAFGGDITATYDPDTRRVTLTGTANFRPTMPENLAKWTGFTQAMSAGWSTSWTAASEPGAVLDLIGAEVEPVESWDLVDLSTYRHGRAKAVAWGNHDVARVTLHMRSERLAAADHSFAFAGRVKVYQVDANTGDFGPLNPGGIVDGFVVGVGDPQEDGDTGELVTQSLLIAIPRGV